MARGLGPVETHRHVIEKKPDAHGRDGIVAAGLGLLDAHDIPAQFHGAGEIEIPPRA
jgi:hypothetical protein